MNRMLSTEKVLFYCSLIRWCQSLVTAPTVADAAKHFNVLERVVKDAVEEIIDPDFASVSDSNKTQIHFNISWDNYLDHGIIDFTELPTLENGVRFTGKEAAAIMAGLYYMINFSAMDDRQDLEQLMAKILRTSSSEPEQIMIAQSSRSELVDLINQAAKAKVSLQFRYLNSYGKTSDRRVDPFRLITKDRDIFLLGYCYNRNEARVFRLSRISELVITNLPAKSANDFKLTDELFHESATDLHVIVEVPFFARELLADYLTPDQSGLDQGQLRLRIAHEQTLVRLVSGRPGLIKVISPESARNAVSRWAEQAVLGYN